MGGKGVKTGGRDFKKGVVTNPKGRPPLPPEINAARKLTKLEVEAALTAFIDMDYQQLVDFFEAKKGTVFQIMVAGILYYAIKTGDQTRFNFFLDRLIGKVTENMNLSGNLNMSLVAFVAAQTKLRQQQEED